MKGVKTAINRHRGPVLVRPEMLFISQGIVEADHVYPSPLGETLHTKWTKITKTAAYQLLETGEWTYTKTEDGSIRLEAENGTDQRPTYESHPSITATQECRTVFNQDTGGRRLKKERRKGKLIVLEGGDGAGKSTQAKMLLERLKANGAKASGVQDPGTTDLGLHLREFLKGDHPLLPETELLLFAAGRAQLVEEIILPSLKQGTTVVADRFEASMMAYQGLGRGLVLKSVEYVNYIATSGLRPDLNIFLDLDPRTGLTRTKQEQQGTGTPAKDGPRNSGRFEEQPIAFHRKVRAGYLAQVRAEPNRWAVIDGATGPDEVHEAVWEKVLEVIR